MKLFVLKRYLPLILMCTVPTLCNNSVKISKKLNSKQKLVVLNKLLLNRKSKNTEGKNMKLSILKRNLPLILLFSIFAGSNFSMKAMESVAASQNGTITSSQKFLSKMEKALKDLLAIQKANATIIGAKIKVTLKKVETCIDSFSPNNEIGKKILEEIKKAWSEITTVLKKLKGEKNPLAVDTKLRQAFKKFENELEKLIVEIKKTEKGETVVKELQKVLLAIQNSQKKRLPILLKLAFAKAIGNGVL